MYKFKRNIYLEDRTIEMWFGLTSKSRDRHSNFTLYLLTEGPDSPFSYAEQIKSGINSKSETERYVNYWNRKKQRKTRNLLQTRIPISTKIRKQTNRHNIQNQ
mgnify:CR=1 FL=1